MREEKPVMRWGRRGLPVNINFSLNGPPHPTGHSTPPPLGMDLPLHRALQTPPRGDISETRSRLRAKRGGGYDADVV